MSTSSPSYVAARSVGWQRAADYLILSKPKIMLMELVTVAVAAVVAGNGAPDFRLLFHTLLGTFLVAAGASAWNQWLEPRSDALMNRTAGRPLAAARMTSREVAWFGTTAALAGVAYLGLVVNPATAVVGALTWLVYVGVYTPLKSRSPANTAVGAVSGALPILMGWTAVGEPLDLTAAALFMVVFLWQFPHVMAVAWIYRQQYGAAGLKMLPVVEPTGRRAGIHAVASASILVPVSLVPAIVGVAGPAYLFWALALGLGQLAFAVAFLRRRDDRTARVLFRATLIYLPALLLWLAAGCLDAGGSTTGDPPPPMGPGAVTVAGRDENLKCLEQFSSGCAGWPGSRRRDPGGSETKPGISSSRPRRQRDETRGLEDEIPATRRLDQSIP